MGIFKVPEKGHKTFNVMTFEYECAWDINEEIEFIELFDRLWDVLQKVSDKDEREEELSSKDLMPYRPMKVIIRILEFKNISFTPDIEREELYKIIYNQCNNKEDLLRLQKLIFELM